MEKTRNGLAVFSVKRLSFVVFFMLIVLHSFEIIQPFSVMSLISRRDKTFPNATLPNQNMSALELVHALEYPKETTNSESTYEGGGEVTGAGGENATVSETEPIRYEQHESFPELKSMNETSVMSERAALRNSSDGTQILNGEGSSEHNEGQQEDTGRNATSTQNEKDSEGCLKYIFYDKPVKTGSTAISKAIRGYLREKSNETDVGCARVPSCAVKAAEICNGSRNPSHLLSHITISDKLFYCMTSLGYYSITSIRKPEDRWRSSYYYNVKVGATHYGIPSNSTYEEFMSIYPRCALLHYYDGEGMYCDAESEIGIEKLKSRVERIAARFDEIIDLDDEPKGVVELAIAKYLERENVTGGAVTEVQTHPDRSRLEVEEQLYAALKEKRKKGPSGRRPCILN